VKENIKVTSTEFLEEAKKKKRNEKEPTEQKKLVSICWNDYVDDYVLEIPLVDPTLCNNAALPQVGSSDKIVSEEKDID
jgi:hypothetical protein